LWLRSVSSGDVHGSCRFYRPSRRLGGLDVWVYTTSSKGHSRSVCRLSDRHERGPPGAESQRWGAHATTGMLTYLLPHRVCIQLYTHNPYRLLPHIPSPWAWHVCPLVRFTADRGLQETAIRFSDDAIAHCRLERYVWLYLCIRYWRPTLFGHWSLKRPMVLIKNTYYKVMLSVSLT